MNDEQMEEQIVQMLDEETNESLTMQVCPDTLFEKDGHKYAVLTPHETVVKILQEIPDEDADEEDDDVECFSLEELEPEEYKAIQRHVSDALKPWNCQITVRADEFILEGEPPEEFFERDDMEEPIDVQTDDGEEDTYIVLQRIDTGDKQYLIIMPEDPELYPAEMLGPDKARRLNDDELEKLQSKFEEVLHNAMGEEDDWDDEPEEEAPKASKKEEKKADKGGKDKGGKGGKKKH